MNTFYCFIARGKSMTPDAVVLSSDDTLPQLLSERYTPAKDYESVIVAAGEWNYPDIGMVSPDGKNIDWNVLWNAAYDYLVEKRGVSPISAKLALEKTASNSIGTFVYMTGKVTFGVPVEETAAMSEPKNKGFILKTYSLPPKSMPHMFNRGAIAPVVATVSFIEAMPNEEQLAEARKRTPAKPKLIGNTFVKKPEDVFDLFVKDAFFYMYNIDSAADLRGKAYEATSLPIRDVGYAFSKISKRLPYDNVSLDVAEVEKFASLMIEALTAANAAITGLTQPKGVYNCYTTTDFRATSVAHDVTRIQAYEYIILGQEIQNSITYHCYELEFSFHIIQVGKAYTPLNLLPKFV